MDLRLDGSIRTISTNISRHIPPKERHLYHIMLGPNILGTYHTEKEMLDAAPTFPYICCAKVYPSVHSSKSPNT
ncbi:MAG: hypothetical protein V3W20_02650 [Candidatus Neomarinimicrobiota bacterium]